MGATMSEDYFRAESHLRRACEDANVPIEVWLAALAVHLHTLSTLVGSSIDNPLEGEGQ